MYRSDSRHALCRDRQISLTLRCLESAFRQLYCLNFSFKFINFSRSYTKTKRVQLFLCNAIIAECCRKMSVCLSVRLYLSHAGIESKRLNISTDFFHLRIAIPFQFFHTKRYGNIPTATLITGASNAGGMKTSLYLGNDTSYKVTMRY